MARDFSMTITKQYASRSWMRSGMTKLLSDPQREMKWLHYRHTRSRVAWHARVLVSVFGGMVDLYSGSLYSLDSANPLVLNVYALIPLSKRSSTSSSTEKCSTTARFSA